jgi:hypothetical protein
MARMTLVVTFVGVGFAMILLSLLFLTPRACPPPSYNGSGPPPPTAPCISAGYLWSDASILIMGSGVAFLACAGILALWNFSSKNAS